MTRRKGLAWLALFAGLAVPALAHHGFTGRYDTNNPIWIEGVVERLATAPPHPTMRVRIDSPAPSPGVIVAPSELTGPIRALSDGAGRAVEVEFPPVAAFYAMGEKVRVGDRVAIIALRNCRPPHQLRSQWLRLSSGELIERAGRLSYQSRGCAE
jgi:hypothetical protein